MQGDTTDVSFCWIFATRTKKSYDFCWETSSQPQNRLPAWLLDPNFGSFIFELGTELISSGPAATKTWLGQDKICIWNTLGIHACLLVFAVYMCCALILLRLVQTYKKQIDQYAKLSIFCSGVSDLVFLRATPLSHLGPWQLWKILCRRFRTWCNDSRIECSIGKSADECGCSQKPCVILCIYKFVLSKTGP